MASKPPALAKRFQPYLQQAQTAADLQYGPQEAAFASILGNAKTDYTQQQAAQAQAASSLVASLKAAGPQETQNYSDVGLTPSVLANLVASGVPSAQRLASEAASAQTGIQNQLLGAQAGAAYQQQDLFNKYQQNLGDTNNQIAAEQANRGEYTTQQLNGLISDDRTRRAAANAATKAQNFTASQNALKNTQSQADALIGAGIDPTTNTPLPARATNPKPKAKPQASAADQSKAENMFDLAVTGAKAVLAGHPVTKAQINSTINALVEGSPAVKGQPGQIVYRKVDVKNNLGKVTGHKNVPVLNPDGTVKTKGATQDQPAVGAIDAPIAQAAVEMATQGYLSPKTVKALHTLGYTVNDLPGVRTTFNKPDTTVNPYSPAYHTNVK